MIPRQKATSLVFPLGLGVVSYGMLYYVRTLQAWSEFGRTVDLYPLAGLVRSLELPAGADQLRWMSYTLFAIISVSYLWAVSLASNCRMLQASSRDYYGWVVVPYLVLGLVSLVLYPAVSRPLDTVDGAVHARTELLRNENPYLTTGLAVKRDEPLVQFMEVKDRPLIYGPVHQYLSLLPAALGQGQLLPTILAFKSLYFLAGLSVLWLIWVFHSRLDSPDRQWALLSGVIVGWNPILHLVSHGEGHNDILMATLLAASIVAMGFQKTLLAFGGWAGSLLVKFVSAPLFFALLAWSCIHDTTAKLSKTLKLTAAGVLLSAAMMVVAFMPFGTAGLVQTVSSRYGSLVDSGGESKIAALSGLVSTISNHLGIPAEDASVAAWIGLIVPLTWGLFTAWRGCSVRCESDFVRVAVESLLIYVTFVSLPVYAQYVVTPVVLAGLLSAQDYWHRAAVIVASLALAWDSLFLVYLPPTLPGWELFLHRVSHFVVLSVFVAYVLAWANHHRELRWRQA